MNCNPGQAARLRLFCFPYAGGSAAIYRPWVEGLGTHAEVWAVEYPAHGLRRFEPAVASIHHLADAIHQAIVPHLDRPFAFFGHSMGALIGFEVLRRLKAAGAPEAASLFVSGCRGPSCESRRRPTFDLPEPEFVEELRLLGGTPSEVLDDDELMRFLMPTLRADFEASETYAYSDGPKLTCPAFAYGGLQDAEVTSEDLATWQRECSLPLKVRMFPGDHFFIHNAQSTLLRVLWSDLMSLHRP